MFKRSFFLMTALILINLSVRAQEIHWETAIYNYDIWKYYVGNSEPDLNWCSVDFNDSLWLKGKGGIGFGDGDDSTIIGPCYSVYLRKKFQIADTSKIIAAILNIDYDDAFIAYLNNVEIARAGITGIYPPYNTSGINHEAKMYTGGTPDYFNINKALLKQCLQNGDNVLSVQVHNTSITSSDLSSIVFLSFSMNENIFSYGAPPAWFQAPVTDTSFLNFESNLPLISIFTNGNESVPDGTKITARMRIIDNGPGVMNHLADSANNYYGNIGIEIRGSFSALFPQKGYNIETRDSASNNRNVKLLGMPSENDWALIANYNDKVFMRNTLSYYLFNEMGHYASRTRYCEVFLNSVYEGIYFLGEKIKWDNERVNISKLKVTDNTGDNVTGGYIIKNDYKNTGDEYWYSSYSEKGIIGVNEIAFIYQDPKSDEITAFQKQYMPGFIYSFEQALYGNNFKDPAKGYRAYINVSSFIDYFILSEVSRNVDSYKKSKFFYKDRDSKGGLLNSGPPWDYDWAYKNIPECQFGVTDGSSWAYEAIECSHWPAYPGWMPRLMQDANFENELKTRYVDLRKTTLSNENIFHFVDSVNSLLNEAQKRHYTKWDILGKISIGSPEVDPQPATFNGVITQFKNWISTRLAWLDNNMPGSIITKDSSGSEAIIRVFPNPASDIVFIESDNIISKIELYSLTGSKIKVINNEVFSIPIKLDGLTKGFYLVRITLKNSRVTTRSLVVK